MRQALLVSKVLGVTNMNSSNQPQSPEGTENLISLTIDNQSYSVEKGQNLLQACLSLGLDLPYFLLGIQPWAQSVLAGNAPSLNIKTVKIPEAV